MSAPNRSASWLAEEGPVTRDGSRLWPTCSASPSSRWQCPRGAALGAAFLARMALGLEASIEDAARWARWSSPVEPAPDWAAAADERYQRWLRRFCPSRPERERPQAYWPSDDWPSDDWPSDDWPVAVARRAVMKCPVGTSRLQTTSVVAVDPDETTDVVSVAGGDEFDNTVTDVVAGETVRTPERSAPRRPFDAERVSAGLAAPSPRWTAPAEARAPPM